MKREAINHTKMRRLARYLAVEIYSARGIMESLWSATRDEAPSGNIGKLSNEDIADIIGWKGDPAALTAAMVKAGWLDTTETYRLVIHDWPDHCEDYVHAKLAKAGLRFANGSIPQISKLNQTQRKNVPAAADFKMPPAFEPTPPAAVVAAPAPNVAATSGNSADAEQPIAAPAPTLSAPVLVPIPSNPIPSNPTTAPLQHQREPRRVPDFDAEPTFPDMATSIRVLFPDTDDSMLRAIVNKSMQSVISAGKDPELVTDAALVEAVRVCTKKAQHSAALYLTTVPTCMRNWAMEGS